jgi:hypothetical protein
MLRCSLFYVSIRLWKTYVLPRRLYGIEILNYTKGDIEEFEKLQLQVCRQIQGLPNRTANIATYSLLGIEPIEATVDKLLLTFFSGVAQDKLCIEYKIIERQLRTLYFVSVSVSIVVNTVIATAGNFEP